MSEDSDVAVYWFVELRRFDGPPEADHLQRSDCVLSTQHIAQMRKAGFDVIRRERIRTGGGTYWHVSRTVTPIPSAAEIEDFVTGRALMEQVEEALSCDEVVAYLERAFFLEIVDGPFENREEVAESVEWFSDD